MIAIQINGKLRADMTCASDLNKEDVENQARVVVQEKLQGKTIVRVVVVPNRLVNFVLSE